MNNINSQLNKTYQGMMYVARWDEHEWILLQMEVYI